jgi:hypothetical protein
MYVDAKSIERNEAYGPFQQPASLALKQLGVLLPGSRRYFGGL